MASFDDYPAADFIKLLYIGDSGTGKTGSLVSLVKAGYKLKLLDMDANAATLRAYIKKECPELISSVDVETRRDKFKMTPGGVVVNGQPKAYVEAIKLLDKWSDDSVPAEWGADTILVIDSLTRLSDATFEWAKGMNPTTKDPRQWYGAAQDSIEHVLSLLTSAEFRTNVIVISHVQIVERADGTTKGYVNSVGKALGPIIPTYFPTLVLAETTGTGVNAKRKIKTLPTAMLDLKNPAPFSMPADLPLETGLATIFETLKAN